MAPMSSPPQSLREALRRGALRRCPACGAGRIFRSFLGLRRSCPACGWVVEREPGAVTGSMYLIAIFGQLFAVALLALIWLLTDWSVGTQMAVALPLIALFSLGALPVSKGLWVGVEYHTDVATGRIDEPDYRAKAYERKS